MNSVYKLKENYNEDSLLGLGFTKLPGTNVFAKIVEQEMDSEPVKALLTNYYNNPVWIEKFYNQNKKLFKKELDLKYNKKGEIIMTEKFKKIISSWVVQINSDDEGWVGFTPYDKNDRHVFYNKDILYKFCNKTIMDLFLLELIEEIEVE